MHPMILQSPPHPVPTELRSALEIWQAGVARVRGEAATRQALADDGDHRWTAILAIGKAASSMTLGAINTLTRDGRALVITKHHHVDEPVKKDPRITTIESGHPIPDQRSLEAGCAAIEFVESLGANEELLVLVSGGASALVECLVPGFDLDHLVSMTDHLLAEGYSIDQMNLLRTRVSKVKGGKLLRRFRGRRIQAYAISDIPGDDADLIGSGIGGINRPGTKSVSISEHLKLLLASVPEEEQEEVAPNFEFNLKLIATNGLARRAAADKAFEKGLTVLDSSAALDGNVASLARTLGAQIDFAQPGVYLWGGEPTVTLPKNPGAGGRNQSLTIALTIEMTTVPQAEVYAVVAGTDGTDGPTDAAGGVIYPGIDLDGAQDALSAANAEPWLRSRNRLLVTGPTGTNVMDLAVIVVRPKN